MYAAPRRGRPNSPAYLCSGIAVCGMPDCGRPLHGRPRKNMKPYDDGSVRRQYWCGPYWRGGCARIAVDQRDLDEAAAALAIGILSDPRNTAAIETAAREIASEAARLDLEIVEAEDVAEALADRLGRGEITLTRYDKATKPLDACIQQLKAERAALSPPGSVPRRSCRWRQAANSGSGGGGMPIRRRGGRCSRRRCAADV
jgi:site-specific DNA recombinase